MEGVSLPFRPRTNDLDRTTQHGHGALGRGRYLTEWLTPAYRNASSNQNNSLPGRWRSRREKMPRRLCILSRNRNSYTVNYPLAQNALRAQLRSSFMANRSSGSFAERGKLRRFAAPKLPRCETTSPSIPVLAALVHLDLAPEHSINKSEISQREDHPYRPPHEADA
jgi:hypothetical protein